MTTRKFAQVPCSFWHNNEIKQFGIDTMIAAIYLRSSPHSNMIYLYRLQPEYAAVDTGLSVQAFLEAIQNLESINYCSFDPATNVVWVRSIMIEDLGQELKEKDNRVAGIQKLLKGIPDCKILSDFRKEFRLKYHLNYKGASKGASKQEISDKGQVTDLPYQEEKINNQVLSNNTTRVYQFPPNGTEDF